MCAKSDTSLAGGGKPNNGAAAAADTEKKMGGQRDGVGSKKLEGTGVTTVAPSTGFISLAPLLFLMGLCTTSLLNTAVYMTKLYLPEDEESSSLGIVLSRMPNLSYEQTLSLSVVSFTFLLLYILKIRAEVHLTALQMPIVPSNLPYFGSATQFLSTSPWDLMTKWHRHYGSIYAFHLLGRVCVSISHPDYLRIILQSKIRNAKKDVQFAYKPFLSILGTGIVTSEGKDWMKQRLKMSTALRIDVLDVIPRITLGAVQRLMTKMDVSAKNGTSLELAEELRHLTLQVISETFLSLSSEESDTTFAQMYLPIVEESNKRVWHPERSYMFFLPSYWRYVVGVWKLNRYVSKLIRDRWTLRMQEKQQHNGEVKKQREEDVLDRILANYEKEYPGKKQLTESAVRQFRDEMKTFMLAGHETSAAMMTWALYELMDNEELMDQVSAEGESVFGLPSDMDWCASDTNELSPPREKLSELILAEGCLKEALRKYAVVPTVQRRIVSPTQVGPHRLPKGCSVMIGIQAIHHDPKYWPNPMKFDPRRFTDPNNRPKPYTFLPFIEGPRNCLGQHLALLESKMVLGLLTQRYHIRYAGKEEVKTDLGGGDKEFDDPRHRYMVPVIPKDDVNVYVTRK